MRFFWGGSFPFSEEEDEEDEEEEEEEEEDEEEDGFAAGSGTSPSTVQSISPTSMPSSSSLRAVGGGVRRCTDKKTAHQKYLPGQVFGLLFLIQGVVR